MSIRNKHLSASLFGVLASSLSLATVYTPSASATVIGHDNRQTPSYSWMKSRRKPVGQLEIRKGDGRYYRCSFTVVGPNIGLTNAHCLLDSKGRKPLQIKAYAVRHGSRVYAKANVTNYWTPLRRSPGTVKEYRNDWAIVRLGNNMSKRTGWFGNEGYYKGVRKVGQTVRGKLTHLIGYSGDWPTAKKIKPGQRRGQTPGAHFNCRLATVNSGLIFHNCDTNPGASGSGAHNSKLRLQALHNTGGWTLKGRRLNGAVPLERFMPAIKKLRQHKGSPYVSIPYFRP
ncbi:trypsin-like peptidase domain-containing protein [filamentous cyanobacterium LEGE 11480]|uniref:Trypsin-like peptidase domain-containing protein n=1 Tax=Romeriopsis navalis LEGE 11480 TaxID=2777977 RepID=A0A928Z640_9CYAN|nr:trypsin-like serine protease [Romeriopsis navalis]MBE9033424.1 trypsin-like peptidase domain-containing protein [Romeriopsis navalis LEGE 11480]